MTELVHFVFSGGGAVLLIGLALLWTRLRDRSVLARRVLASLVLGYITISIQPVSHGAGRLLTRGYRPFTTADVPGGRAAVVLLGSSTYMSHDWDEHRATVPDRTGSERVLEAVRVFRRARAEWIISSGGRVYADDHSPASGAVMRDMLIQRGVPAAQVLVETESRNTHDEAVIVRTMLKSLAADRVILVTSDLHMRRAQGAFRAEGIETIPAIARTPQLRPAWNLRWLPSDAGLSEARSVAHELLGICYYLARGWYRFS